MRLPSSSFDKWLLGRWTVEQVTQLHRLLGQHTQLLMTTFCAAAALPGFDAHVGASGSMIHALQACYWLPPCPMPRQLTFQSVLSTRGFMALLCRLCRPAIAAGCSWMPQWPP
jgi:hypothetical protein